MFLAFTGATQILKSTLKFGARGHFTLGCHHPSLKLRGERTLSSEDCGVARAPAPVRPSARPSVSPSAPVLARQPDRIGQLAKYPSAFGTRPSASPPARLPAPGASRRHIRGIPEAYQWHTRGIPVAYQWQTQWQTQISWKNV